MNNKHEGILVRFVKGKIPISTSFFLIYIPVYGFFILGAEAIGGWFGRLTAKHNIPVEYFVYVMLFIALFVACGAGLSAWKTRGLYADVIFLVILFFSGPYLYGWLKLL